MPDVIIAEFMDEASVDRLSARCDTHYEPALADNPDALATLAARARALIVRNRVQVRGALLEGARRLSCVGRLGVGLDNIDTEACRRRGIEVYPATGANSVSVAEYVITATLVLLRGAWRSTPDMIAGEWPRQELIGREASGKTLGLVGFGSIARATATRARALGMKVLATDPYLPVDDPAWKGTERVSVDAVFSSADVVSLHVPLTAETRHLASRYRLAQMRPGAILINTARGGVVDPDALCDALASGQLGGAALDVFEVEPLRAVPGARFQGLNVILTPHIAGVTAESNRRASELVCDRVQAHLED